MKSKNAPSDTKSSTNKWEPALSLTDKTAHEAGACCQSEDERQRDIEVAAYFLAEKRGFSPGFELEDWLAAEKCVSAGSSMSIAY